MSGFDRWLYAPAPVRGFALFRIAFGLILLQRYAPRMWYAEELYSDQGFIVPRGFVRALGLGPVPEWLATTLVIAVVVAFVLVTIGAFTRVAAAFAAPVMLYLICANEVFSCAVDDYSVTALALIAVGSAHREFSVDAWRAKRRGQPLELVAPPWPQRLLSVVFVSTYVYAPLLRLNHNGLHFFSGDPLAQAFTRWQFVTDGSAWVADQLWLMVPIAIGSTVGEWFIAVGLFVRKLRPYAIAFGVMLHGFVLVAVLIPPGLSLIMMASYILFIDWRPGDAAVSARDAPLDSRQGAKAPSGAAGFPLSRE